MVDPSETNLRPRFFFSQIKQKRQVTFPKEVCQILNAKEGTYVAFAVIEGQGTFITINRIDAKSLLGKAWDILVSNELKRAAVGTQDA